MVETNREDWHELCAAAANEPDSKKLISLVEQILKAIDGQHKKQMPSDPLEGCN